MTVSLSRLALDALQSLDGLGGAEASLGMENAIRVYLKDRDLQPQGWRYPGFMRETEPEEQVRLDLDLDTELWRSLEREAAEQQVPVDRLAEQAAFYLAAELEAGRVVQRVLDRIEPPEPEGREG